MNIFDLKGKVAVIFGGTSGIGKALSFGLAQAGAEVVPISRDLSKVKQRIKELKRFNKEHLEITADVSLKRQVAEALEKVLAKFKQVDILINSAGIHLKKSSLKVSESEWDQILEVNLKGTFITCQVFGEQMIKQRKGTIVNIASLGAYIALSEATPYCVSKAGVLLLTKCLAVEWAKYHVRVNSISPGVFQTPLNEKILKDQSRLGRIIGHTPFGRLGKTSELIGAAVYLASDASSFVSGSDIVVDGGFLAWGI